ncbi:MAG: HlyD family efflux transporter periplasmic adaptor subunit [Thermosynechococcaceae cyanobacterium MS004]|nr:HlyD family efflux transporter periplasmic adaptor subunit [Thermosynechococcaceae cyanobacterium MS004]
MANNSPQPLQVSHNPPLNDPLLSDQALIGQTNPNYSRHRILIIDDNLVLRKLISSQLTGDLLEVYEAESGQQGIAKALEIQPSLILLDFYMPEMDGYEVYQALKAQEQCAKIPIIVLSASYSDVADRFGALLTHENFLPKQASYEELRDRIHQVLAQDSPSSAGEKIASTTATSTSISLPLQEVSTLITHLCETEHQASAKNLASIQQTAALQTVVEPNTTPHALALPVPEQPAIQRLENDYAYATQELLTALPRVWTRGLLYFVIIFTAIGLPLAVLSKADETGSARGRLEPEGQTFKVGAAESGKVAKVLVKEGQQVVKGQPLLELEAYQVESELQQVQAKLSGQLNQMGQVQLIKSQLNLQVLEQQKQGQTQDLEKQAQVSQAQGILAGKQSTFKAQRAEKKALLDQAKESLSIQQANLHFFQKQVELNQWELDRFLQAQAEGAVPQITVIAKQKDVADSERQLSQAIADIKKAKLQLAEQENQYGRSVAQLQNDIDLSKLQAVEVGRNHQSLNHSNSLALQKVQQQLEELQSQIAILRANIAQSEGQIQSLKRQIDQRLLRSPANGTIYKLPIQRTGAVVEPSALIAEIAPIGTPMILRAKMTTRESGFLHLNMPVRVKFDAYPFQDYGIVKGTLSRISPNSEIENTNHGSVATFEIQVKLKKTCIPSGQKCIALNPGQTATAEVVVRQRRVIDFFLDPFKKLRSSGLKL